MRRRLWFPDNSIHALCTQREIWGSATKTRRLRTTFGHSSLTLLSKCPLVWQGGGEDASAAAEEQVLFGFGAQSVAILRDRSRVMTKTRIIMVMIKQGVTSVRSFRLGIQPALSRTPRRNFRSMSTARICSLVARKLNTWSRLCEWPTMSKRPGARRSGKCEP